MAGKITNFVETVLRKPSSAPDGLTDAEASPTGKEPTEKTSIFSDLLGLGAKNDKTLLQMAEAFASGEPMNDRELLLENVVSMLQKLPANSGLEDQISNGLIGMLWRDLPHPPATVIAPETRYRTGDGSNNNLRDPTLGKAGSPYAQNVQPVRPKPASLPDPDVVFDQLLRRPEGQFKEHPTGLNRLFFSFATIVIHEIFQTNSRTPWINNTSSYVDLSTLYGNTGDEQPRVRTYQNGTLYPDTFASDRIIMMPPGVAALLIMFNRNHNHIASRIFDVNESGKYKPWDKCTDAEKKWQDEDIFQLSRNVNVAFFANIVLRDYVSAILNTVRANSSWNLQLGAEIIQKDGSRLERGSGNIVSVEFAVLYHWHAALSAADEQWIEQVFKRDFPDAATIDDITPQMYFKLAGERSKAISTMEAKQWTFGGLKRNAEGRFDDKDLAELIKDCIEEPAHAFGARSIPSAMKIIEVMSQLQARNVFKVCTLNEFRKYLNLTEYKSFKEWNPDPEVSRAAELLYGHIDRLELYPGLHAEETKPPMPGSGVCPGHTTGRGILDDAVSLVRSDRFLTYDYNTTTLTNWGMAQLTARPGAYGGMLGSVLFTALPNAWTGTSSYVLLPFYTPKAIRQILKDNKVLDQYDTQRPLSKRKMQGIWTLEGCKRAFEDRETFATMYNKAIIDATGHEFMIGWDNAARHDPRSQILHHAFYQPGFEESVTKFFTETVTKLIRDKSLSLSKGRKQLDVARDVCNVAPIAWIAHKFGIPIKDEQHPKGILSHAELFGILLVAFIYTSFNIIPHAEWTLREKVHELLPSLASIVRARAEAMRGGVVEKAVEWLSQGTAYEASAETEALYKVLHESKLPVADFVNDCISIMTPVAGNITQQATLLVDLYLSEGYEKYKERIVELAHLDTKEADDELVGWVLEGMRHSGVVPGLPRTVTKDVKFQDGDRTLDLKAGELVLVCTSVASMDPKAFPNPEKLDPHRPRHSYILLGSGLHYCFGARLVTVSIATMIKQIFRLKNLRRAPGPAGRLDRIIEDLGGATGRLYLDPNCAETPIPLSLRVEYDD
ncbi:hypothetical protein HDV00_004291 [Rhizophlyctis rosea]|nr:hypothetical protein HDV00_004291 [Rhizophlyctis rosea]